MSSNTLQTILSDETGTLSSALDLFGPPQGSVLYRDATVWKTLSPGVSGQVLTSGGAAANPSWGVAAGTGTVTSVSVASANGFAGTVANPTISPAITLTTTVSGILQGNGTAISAASTTGSGSVALNNSPSFTTPTLGAATATSINKIAFTQPATGATLTLVDGTTLTGPAASGTAMTLGNAETVTGAKTFNSGNLILAGATSGTTLLNATAIASGTLTLPAATDTLVARNTTDTLSNKTFSDQPSVRLNLTVPVYVTSLAALQALDTTKDVCAYVTATGKQFPFNWTAGNFSSQITAADPRYIASNANPTGSSGAWIQSGSVQTGHFYRGDGGRIHNLADRVFVGAAVENNGNQVASGGDWLTTFQLGTGRAGGFIQEAQLAVLNNSDPQSVNAFVTAAQTANITLAGLNAIGAISAAINNNSSVAVSAFAQYSEFYRMSGALGAAFGYEIDSVNYASSVTINPFAQQGTETVNLQLAAGAGLASAGQFPASAGINFWNNNSTFNTGINFGFTAIAGTNGTDGNTGEAVAMATGHAINYYYGNATKSWTLKANIGVNGNYLFTTAGTGAVAVPRVFAGSGLATPTASATISNNAAALPTPLTGTVLHTGAVDGANARVLIDSFGTGASSVLSFRTARNTAASPAATQTGDALINAGGFGYGATGYSSTAAAGFLSTATENWTDTAHGSDFSIRTTLNGTTTLATVLNVGNNGMVSLPGGSLSQNAPVTKTASFTLGAAENWVICNGTATITATWPAASSFSGREVTIRTIAAFTVVSASSNVVPLAGGAAGTAILAATAGKWATLVSDGTNWQIMASN